MATFTTEPCPTPETATRTPKRKAPETTPEPTPQYTGPQAQPKAVTSDDFRSMVDQMKEFQVSMINRMVALEERPPTRIRHQQYLDQEEPDSSDADSIAPSRPTVTRPAPTPRHDPEYPTTMPAPRRGRKAAGPPVAYEEYATTDSCASVNRRKQFAHPNEEEASHSNQAVTVSELLHAAGNAMGKKQGKNPLLPHLFVIRGHKREKVAYGEATWHEYIAALCKMMNSSEVPLSWREPLLDHVQQIATMAADWDWETCMWWSERVFTMIDDGRLPHGWADEYAVKDVQRDAFAIGVRTTARPQRTQTSTAPRQAAPANGYKARQTNTTYNDQRQEFNRETDGKPCNAWNWGGDCAYSTTHGQLPDKKAHVCAWCANKYHRANIHKEMDCLNKKRFLEKKANQGATSTQQADQGF